MIQVNLGCGSHTPDGWINVDYAFGAFLFKIPGFKLINKKLKIFNINWSNEIFLHDLRKPLPWKDNSIDIIYSSHTLEHLSKMEGRMLLKECYRVLKPNGIIRIVVPDLKAIISSYETIKIPADELLEKLHVSYESPYDKGLKKFVAPLIRCPHKCMYDTPTLLAIISKIGFDAYSKQPFTSEIKDIGTIEKASRVFEAVIVEGRKYSMDKNLKTTKLSIFSN